jgi:hypothetical protein
VVSRFLGRT